MVNPSLTSLISSFRCETAAGAITPESLGSLLQKIVNAIPEGGSGTSGNQLSAASPIFHIECQPHYKKLFVKGDILSLMALGYIPFLFRYSVKHNRFKIHNSNAHQYGPTIKGWNQFYGAGKVDLDKNGLISFKRFYDVSIESAVKGTDPSFLFNHATMRTNRDKEVNSVRIPFGRRMVECIKGHRFRFAIGFAPKQVRSSFDYSTLVTNLAEFQVFVRYNVNIKTVLYDFSL